MSMGKPAQVNASDQVVDSERVDATLQHRILLWVTLIGALATVVLNSDLLAVIRELAMVSAWSQFRLAVIALSFLTIPFAFLLRTSRQRSYLLWLLPIIGTLMLFDVAYGGRDPDEAVHLRMAWLITQGLLPYVDFFTVRNLLWHLCIAPLTVLMEDDMRILAVVRTIELVVTLVTFAWLVPVSRAARCHPILPFLVFAFPFFAWGAVEFRADPPMTLLLVGSLWALSKNRPVLAGVLSGLAYLMLQKAAFHGVAIGAGILLSGMGLRTLILYGVPATIISLLPFIPAYLTRIGSMYFTCAYQSSSAFAAYHQQTPLLESMPTLVFGLEARAIPVFFLAAAIGVYVWWRGGRKYERMLAVALVVDLLLIFGTKLAFKNYLLFPLLLLGLAVGTAFEAASRLRWKSELEATLPLIATLLLALVSTIRWSAVPPNRILVEESTFILQILPKDETYYGDGLRSNLASPIFRKNPNYYAHDQSAFQAWIQPSGFVTPYHAPNDLQSVAKKPPGVAVLEKARAEVFLEVMNREANTAYIEVEPGIYLREDLFTQAKPYLTPARIPSLQKDQPIPHEE